MKFKPSARPSRRNGLLDFRASGLPRYVSLNSSSGTVVLVLSPHYSGLPRVPISLPAFKMSRLSEEAISRSPSQGSIPLLLSENPGRKCLNERKSTCTRPEGLKGRLRIAVATM